MLFALENNYPLALENSYPLALENSYPRALESNYPPKGHRENRFRLSRRNLPLQRLTPLKRPPLKRPKSPLRSEQSGTTRSARASAKYKRATRWTLLCARSDFAYRSNLKPPSFELDPRACRATRAVLCITANSLAADIGVPP
jgi:hypothetical protein